MKRLDHDDMELGTVTALLLRASHRRIPRLLRIKKAMDDGKCLNNYQINFLKRVFEDAERAIPYIDHHPEMQDMAVKTVALYREITEQAIKNEEAKLRKKVPHIDLPDK
jgi:hypothetical protein